MASSSSTIDSQVDYDVFLSFRGGDTRYNFTSHLYNNLCRKNIKAFIDYDIRRGEEITPFLEKIIEGVKLSIIVFSSGYASSPFCLDEMVKIMECKNTKAQIVSPIFYKVDPSEETYQEAFTTHRANLRRKTRVREETVDQETMEENSKAIFRKALHFVSSYWRTENEEMKVEKWKSSMDEAFKLAGWHIHDYDDEAISIERITRDVLEKLNCELEGEMKSTPMVGQTSEDYLERIMQLLMNDENPKVGLWGMGGVGKTTIVTHINNKLLEVGSFSHHIYWVTISKDSNIYKLQHSIAEVIKLDLSGEENESKRAAKLFNMLKRINKFVLILDDVWEAFEIEDVGIPLMGGQKLLLTTRYFGVCQRMMCQPIEVKPLSQHDSVVLFMKESQLQINDFGERSEIVHCIVKECGGLPLAIVVVARRMRGVVEIGRWRNILRVLQKPCEWGNKELEKVYNPLKFSYDHLPDDRCRRCFLYCSMFPEDHILIIEDLIEYWIGEGLIDELDSRQAELDQGNEILNELVHSSLLQGDEHFEWVKMHDVVRDMAHIVVKIGLRFQSPLDSVEVLNCGTMSQSFPKSASHSSKLKTLVLRGMDMTRGHSIPGCFFDNMQALNILHVEHVKSIPDCITNLKNLRLLIIVHCSNLECIPSLAGLEKLQHLMIFMNEDLKKIPEGIERLVNLRVLDLSANWAIIGSLPSSILQNLSNLQILDLSLSRIEVEVETLISLQKIEIVRVQFFNMQKLNCYIKSGHWRRLLDYQINYGMDHSGRKGMCLKGIGDVEERKGECGIFVPDDLQTLKLSAWDSTMFNGFNNSNFAHLQTIIISEYEDKCLFTVHLAQRILHNVRELSIGACVGLEEIIATEEESVNQSNHPSIVLPNLKILRLVYLDELRSIYKGRMVCHSLELIEISSCNNVKRLPFCLEKEENRQNLTISVRGCWGEDDLVSRKWWDSLQWDDQNSKSMYQPMLTESESEDELSDLWDSMP